VHLPAADQREADKGTSPSNGLSLVSYGLQNTVKWECTMSQSYMVRIWVVVRLFSFRVSVVSLSVYRLISRSHGKFGDNYLAPSSLITVIFYTSLHQFIRSKDLGIACQFIWGLQFLFVFTMFIFLISQSILLFCFKTSLFTILIGIHIFSSSIFSNFFNRDGLEIYCRHTTVIWKLMPLNAVLKRFKSNSYNCIGYDKLLLLYGSYIRSFGLFLVQN
jgi:hypothetical protein